MHKFTVFCRESNGTGTTYMGCVEIEENDPNKASEAGLQQCLAEWNDTLEDGFTYTADNVSVLGVIEGDVKVLIWDDSV